MRQVHGGPRNPDWRVHIKIYFPIKMLPPGRGCGNGNGVATVAVYGGGAGGGAGGSRRLNHADSNGRANGLDSDHTAIRPWHQRQAQWQ
jgi:hypothetical protein